MKNYTFCKFYVARLKAMSPALLSILILNIYLKGIYILKMNLKHSYCTLFKQITLVIKMLFIYLFIISYQYSFITKLSFTLKTHVWVENIFKYLLSQFSKFKIDAFSYFYNICILNKNGVFISPISWNFIDTDMHVLQKLYSNE